MGTNFFKINIFYVKNNERTPERIFQKCILNNFSRRITQMCVIKKVNWIRIQSGP